MLVSALALPATAAAAPPNDAFGSAEVLTGASATAAGTNVQATGEAGEPDHANASRPLASAWYSWTAPADGAVAVDTCDAAFDTTIGVYTGTAVGALTTVAANDNGNGCAAGGSHAEFDGAAGETYLIAVDGAANAEGDFTLTVGPAVAPEPAPPAEPAPAADAPAAARLGVVPPAAALPAPAPLRASVRLASPALSMDRAGVVAVRVGCAAVAGSSSCVGQLVLRTAGPVRVGSRRRVVSLARGDFGVPPGATIRHFLVLDDQARRLVARHRALRVRLIAAGADGAGTFRRSRVVRLRASRR